MPDKVLLVHNRYQWLGGEDIAYQLDRALLERHGHEIVTYERDNDDIDQGGRAGRVGVALGSVWSRRSRRDIAEIIDVHRPDIAYFINIFPLVSPSAFAACKAAGVPVVAGMHTYRLACPNAFLFRDGDVCEDCLHKRIKWPSIAHACYRGSRVESGVVAGMLAAHRAAGVWDRLVDRYVAVSEFGRSKLIEAGLPADRVGVRPNFTDPDPGFRSSPPMNGTHALFVGRLSPEKGVDVLVEAFEALPDIPLRILGDGPSRGRIEQFVAERGLTNIEVLGLRPHDEVLRMLQEARLLVFPAMSYEHCPFVFVEAFACGTPVVASDRGAMPEFVSGNDVGILFEPGRPDALAAAVREVWSDDGRLARWSRNARRAFEDKHTPEQAYRRLMEEFGRAV